MGGPLPAEYSMHKGRTEDTASVVPCIISWHGLAGHTGRGQMQAASQCAIVDVSTSTVLERTGPRVPERSPPCFMLETFECLYLRVAVFFVIGTHLKLYLL